jgi:hypothetical protein
LQYIHLVVKPPGMIACGALAARGFHLTGPSGGSIRQVLNEWAGISSDYLDGVVQTVFHNGRAVDDDRKIMAAHGSVIALSAAMPGLVGAAFRKNSPVAGMRTVDFPSQTDISDAELVAESRAGSAAGPSPGSEPITITLKFFNRVNADLGPVFLQQGIRVSGETVQDVFKQYRDRLETFCTKAGIDERPATFAAIDDLVAGIGKEDILITVTEG